MKKKKLIIHGKTNENLNQQPKQNKKNVKRNEDKND